VAGVTTKPAARTAAALLEFADRDFVFLPAQAGLELHAAEADVGETEAGEARFPEVTRVGDVAAVEIRRRREVGEQRGLLTEERRDPGAVRKHGRRVGERGEVEAVFEAPAVVGEREGGAASGRAAAGAVVAPGERGVGVAEAMVVLGGLGAELEPRGQAPRRVPADVGLALPDFRLRKTRVVGEARIGEVRPVAEVAAGGLRDWPIGVVEGGAVELEREAGERSGGEGLRADAREGDVWVGPDGAVQPAVDQPGAATECEPGRDRAGLRVFVLVVGGECDLGVVGREVIQPGPVTEARPPGTLKAAVRLSMKASRELYIAPRERASEGVAFQSRVSEGVTRSVKRGWVIAVTLVRTRGRGSVGVVAAL
jgi:hypothetical protein